MTNLDGDLSDNQARVLGCLMEKQLTTPDYYPLTLKALTTACNQKSSRVPVMSLSASEVGGVINGLRSQGLITARTDGRSDRFEQQFSRKLTLSSKQRAVLCVLMLRGALTLNEIRITTGRMVDFDSNAEALSLLTEMIEREAPLLMQIPRVAGQREDRYAHLLCGEVEVSMDVGTKEACAASDSSKSAALRISQLEQDVATLQQQVEQILAATGVKNA
ncbi:MAG: YceH family protein [Mariprofundales bacterium]|nr:YceH family protein [Mariprofundales bacterium]